MRVGLSKLLPNEKTVFTTRKVKKGDPIAAYGGWSWVSGDPLLPSDNSYQFGIPNTNKILDAKGFGQDAFKGHFINDGLDNSAKCRIRQAPNGAGYLLAYALNDYPIHTEMTTTYERDYWLRKLQWEKLSTADKVKAGELYRISRDQLI